MNIHLLLMSKEPQCQEQEVVGFRSLSIAGTPENMLCCYSFPKPNAMHRSKIYSMQPKYEYKGYNLCGILAFDWQHTSSVVERFWVFYGSFKGYSAWCKIASTATILELGKRSEKFMTYRSLHSRGGNKIEKREAESLMWETKQTWEWIVGLRDGYLPGQESQEPSRIHLGCSLTVSVEERLFLGNYKYLCLLLDVKRGIPQKRTKDPS
jgi:hypothetical protein